MEDIVIALASKAFVNGDVPANLATMLDTMAEAAGRGAALVCFGEAFLQGFDSLCWDYDTDRTMALTRDDAPIRRIREASRSLGVDVLFGFIEREGDALYSSCMLVERGEIACCYRRMSRGWKDCRRTDSHYREGTEPVRFPYRGWTCAVALCGDLWDDTQDRFRLGEDILFWPVYCGYTPEAWRSGARAEYAAQCRDHAPLTLLIDSICEGDSQGGCAAFRAGATAAELPLGTEGLLLVRPVDLMKG